MRYGVRHEIVTIDQELYKMYPLKGEFYAQFMELATSIDAKTKEAKKANPKAKDEDLNISLKASDYKLMTELCTESLIAADTAANRNEVEVFVAQNLMTLLPVMMKVNSPKS